MPSIVFGHLAKPLLKIAGLFTRRLKEGFGWEVIRCKREAGVPIALSFSAINLFFITMRTILAKSVERI